MAHSRPCSQLLPNYLRGLAGTASDTPVRPLLLLQNLRGRLLTRGVGTDPQNVAGMEKTSGTCAPIQRLRPQPERTLRVSPATVWPNYCNSSWLRNSPQPTRATGFSPPESLCCLTALAKS